MAARPLKKVRLACQRCRIRRIKCDGQLPACTNCVKTGEQCLDTDSSNADRLIPRNFTSEARARIEWLESIVKSRLPDVSLTDGPQLDATLSRAPDDGVDEAIASKAYPVAVNLGMLTLNSDSLQRHYLGSSSGLLLTNLMGATPNSTQPFDTPFTNSVSPELHDAVWMDDPAVTTHRSMQQKCKALHIQLQQELPTRKEALALTHTYIQSIHPDFPVLDPQSLFATLDALYDSSTHANDTAYDFFRGWPTSLPAISWNKRQFKVGEEDPQTPPMATLAFIIFTIFNLASIIKVRRRVYGFSPNRYYQAAMLFAPDCFSQISLCSVQALIMLVIHCIHTPADVNLWTLIHIGMANCIELGLHQHHPEDEADVRQLKQFVFYTMYGLDRSISSIQGRPLGFPDHCISVQVPGKPLAADSVGDTSKSWVAFGIARYSHHNFELQRIVSSIKSQLYHRSSELPWPEDPRLSQQRIHSSLKAWWESAFADGFKIPEVDGRYTSVWKLKLQIRFHTAMVLLFQPSQAIKSPSDDSLQTVFDCATCILRDYQLLHDGSNLDYGWRTVQNTFAAGAALIYAFWTSKMVRSRTEAMAMLKTLRTCTSLLSIGGEWWPCAKASLTAFGSIADLTIEEIYSNPSKLKRRRPPSPSPRTYGSGVTPNGADNAERFQWEPAIVAADRDAGRARLSGPLGSQPYNEQYAGNTLSFNTQIAPPWQLDLANTPSQNDTWATSFPEIDSFLAGFNQSEFSWNVPLNDMEAHGDMI